MNHESYVPQQYQGVLLAWAGIAVCVVFNTVLGAILPKVEIMTLLLHVFGFFGILITIAYMSPHNTAKEVFTTFANEGTWATQGLAFFVGIGGVAFAFVGADAAVHVRKPRHLLPASPNILADVGGNRQSHRHRSSSDHDKHFA